MKELAESSGGRAARMRRAEAFMWEPRPAVATERRQGLGRALFLAFALAALLLRTAPLLRTGESWALEGCGPTFPKNPDSLEYIQAADGLKHGCGFARRIGGVCGTAEIIRTPGYPLFLVPFSSLRSVVAAQALLGTFTCLLVALFAWREWGLGAALVAELIMGFDVPSVVNSALILSDTLFTLVLAIAIMLQLWCLSRSRFDRTAVCCSLLAALLFGVAAMVRPIGQFLIVFAPVPAFLLPRRSLKVRAGLALACIALPAAMILGWSLRNYEQRGIFSFSTIAAYNIYVYRAADVTAYLSGTDFEQVQAEFQDRLEHPAGRFKPLEGAETAETAREMERRGTAVLLAHPWVTIYLMLRHFFYLAFIAHEDMLPGYPEAASPIGSITLAHGTFRQKLGATLSSPLLLASLTFQLLLTAFTWLGVAMALKRVPYRRPRKAAPVLIPLLATLLMFALSAGPEVSDARLRIPVVPLLAIVAACGWSDLSGKRTALSVQVPIREA